MQSRSNPRLSRVMAGLLLILLLGLPGRAEAVFNITFVDIFVIDETDGFFEFETDLQGTDLATGSFTPDGLGSTALNTSDAPDALFFDTSFASEAALFAAFPNGVTYTYDINGTGGENANFSFTLNLPAAPTGSPIITSPTPDEATDVALDVALTWTCGWQRREVPGC